MSGANKEEKKSAFICFSNLTLPLFLEDKHSNRHFTFNADLLHRRLSRKGPSIKRRGSRFESRIKDLCTCPEFNEKRRKLKGTRPGGRACTCLR